MTEGTPEGPEIQIELGDVSCKSAGRKRRPDSDRASVVVEYGEPERENIPVFIHEQALRGIESHAASNPSVEVGGALIGGFYRQGENQFVEITDFIVADKAEHSAAQITFTHDTWAQISTEKEARVPEAQIVGWYHTHPDLGIFLSEADMFIQQNFFKEPWQVAMVVDPARGDRGFFQSRRGVLSRTAGFYVTAERSRRKPLQAYVTELETANRQMYQPAQGVRQPQISKSTVTVTWLFLLTVAFLAVLVVEGVRGRPLLSPPPPGIEEQVGAMLKMGEYDEAQRIYARALLDRPKDERLAREFASVREQAEKMPDMSRPRQERFIRWFLTEVDNLAGRGEYEIAERLYNAAGVRVQQEPDAESIFTERDADVLAAYRYLGDQAGFGKSRRDRPAPPDEEGTLRMQTDLRRSWDQDTVLRIESGLKHLISERPSEKVELEKALESLRKEYLLKPEEARS